nr:lysophospholipid acyltransferase family protein [Bacteroidota bacterium]
MKVIGFYLIFSILWLFALLPLRVLYMFSDILFIIVYYLLGYRRDTVSDNLKFAFPEMSSGELHTIEIKFFRHFCDLIIESIKIIHLPRKQLNRRFTYKNPEIFEEYFQKGQSIVLISGHYGNWEWMVDFPTRLKHKSLAIYKPLENRQVDRLVRRVRANFSGKVELIAMQDIYKSIITYGKTDTKIVTWFLSDQTPPKDYPLWISFLNRETPFYSGPEKIARKFGQAVVFMNIDKKKRGNYEAEFIPLFDDPKSTANLEITKAHVKTLETKIKMRPELWLWSHRRWKHSKEK